MSPGVIQVRADICADCPTPCGWQYDAARHADKCAACHLRRWSAWGACDENTNPSTPPPAKMRGLGDLVAKIADPIAKAINLDKAKCGCAARQQRLNELVPFQRPDSAP